MTGDVTLRDISESDIPIFYEQQLDPDAVAMAAFPSRDWVAYRKHWTKVLANESNIKQTIIFDGEVAGNIGVFGPPNEREVGYWIGKQYWGKGVATQALKAMLTHVPERPLFAHVVKHNVASIRVLEKCGFQIVGEQCGVDVGGIVADEFTLKLDGKDNS